MSSALSYNIAGTRKRKVADSSLQPSQSLPKYPRYDTRSRRRKTNSLAEKFNISLSTVEKYFSILTSRLQVPVIRTVPIKKELSPVRFSQILNLALAFKSRQRMRKPRIKEKPKLKSPPEKENVNTAVSQNLQNYFQTLEDIKTKEESYSVNKLPNPDYSTEKPSQSKTSSFTNNQCEMLIDSSDCSTIISNSENCEEQLSNSTASVKIVDISNSSPKLDSTSKKDSNEGLISSTNSSKETVNNILLPNENICQHRLEINKNSSPTKTNEIQNSSPKVINRESNSDKVYCNPSNEHTSPNQFEDVSRKEVSQISSSVNITPYKDQRESIGKKDEIRLVQAPSNNIYSEYKDIKVPAIFKCPSEPTGSILRNSPTLTFQQRSQLKQRLKLYQEVKSEINPQQGGTPGIAGVTNAGKTRKRFSKCRYSSDTSFNEKFYEVNAAQTLMDVYNFRAQVLRKTPYVTFDNADKEKPSKYDNFILDDASNIDITTSMGATKVSAIGATNTQTDFFWTYCFRMIIAFLFFLLFF